ncbi:MAG: TM0106 family RecB-like putative nuclease [Saprospiraceae bacterium]
MKIDKKSLHLSATDLSNHLGCRHLTQINHDVVLGNRIKPEWYDPTLEVLRERGRAFEASYLKHLQSKGLTISRPSDAKESDSSGIDRAINHMKTGTDIIYQASLQKQSWNGLADFLIKVDKPSSLGAWSYEVQDTKLAKETRAGTILQLCLYSQLVESIQGTLPEMMHVISPSNDFNPISYKVNDFIAFNRLVQNKLKSAVENREETYPQPVMQCDTCRWWKICDDRRRADDHLCFVAGISNLHINELMNKNVKTLEALAIESPPFERKPSRGSIETYNKIREQAKIQNRSKKEDQILFEILEPISGLGLERLPTPSNGDIFLDFEGDPYIEKNGLEYLFGWATIETSNITYSHKWALNNEYEKAAFESFIDLVAERLLIYPDLHIYHFGHYEPTALKKLMGKYATRENELDVLLRANIFIDLHSIVKQSLRAGIEVYSLKNLEVFYDYQRQVLLKEASLYIHRIERALEMNHIDLITPEIKSVIEKYNNDDCFSTSALRNWLEKLRSESIEKGINIPRPSNEIIEPKKDELKEEIQAVYNKLIEGIPADPKKRSDIQNAKWIIAHLLGYHQREMKSVWWEYFRLMSLTDEDWVDEKFTISGLNFIRTVDKTKTGIPIDRYEFPIQEVEIRVGDKIETRDRVSFDSVVMIDEINNTIDIKKTGATKDFHPTSIMKNEIVRDHVKRNSIYRTGKWIVENNIEMDGPYQAIIDLILKKSPRPIVDNINDPLITAIQWGTSLDNSYLPIQGPPGSGKTFTGARMIVELVKNGKKIGIVALSHKVIRNLLEEVIDASGKININVSCAEKVTDINKDDAASAIKQIDTNAKVIKAIDANEVNVIGGTPWLWAREDMYHKVDYLFIEEAGQLSLADTVAVSQAAKNLVLMGDPQQLKQPQQGSHPEYTDVSALEHILGDNHTISPDKGLFIEHSRRLHPAICSFTSELFYDSRLTSYSGMENQILIGDTKYAGAGLWIEEVIHQGNQSSSIEEAEKIKSIFDELLSNGIKWQDAEIVEHPLELKDILVIAPYNAQVAKLKKLLPVGSRIGTVDKFQGQEAPIVIFSMTTSTPADAPRGMEFLYSLNRLNVAVSRAKSVCIIVANPDLFEPDCKSPNQMRLANALCRYVEMAKA